MTQLVLALFEAEAPAPSVEAAPTKTTPNEATPHLDRAECSEFFANNYPEVLRAANSYMNSRDDAEDLVMDSFSRMLPHFDEIQPDMRRAYWHRAVRNAVIDQSRRSQRVQFESYDEEDFDGATVEDVSEVVVQREAKAAIAGIVHTALRQIPEYQSAPLYAHMIQGHALQEITHQTGTCVGTLKSRIHRGRTAMTRYCHEALAYIV